MEDESSISGVSMSSVAVRNEARALRCRLSRKPNSTSQTDAEREIRCLHHKYEQMKNVARQEKKLRLLAEKRALENENALRTMQLQLYGNAMHRPHAFQPLFPTAAMTPAMPTPIPDLEQVSIESVEIPHYLMN